MAAKSATLPDHAKFTKIPKEALKLFGKYLDIKDVDTVDAWNPIISCVKITF